MRTAARGRRSCPDRRRVFGEAIEAAAPAAAMPVALCDGIEFRLMEDHPGLAANFLERDGDEGLVAAAAVLAIPREGVDQALRRDDLAHDAAVPQIAAAAVGPQAAAPSSAGPRLVLEMHGGETARTHPALHVCGVGPQLEHELARRIEHALDDEHALRGIGSAANGVACAHASSPWLAACAGIRRADRSSAPRTDGSDRPNPRLL